MESVSQRVDVEMSQSVAVGCVDMRCVVLSLTGSQHLQHADDPESGEVTGGNIQVCADGWEPGCYHQHEIHLIPRVAQIRVRHADEPLQREER